MDLGDGPAVDVKWQGLGICFVCQPATVVSVYRLLAPSLLLENSLAKN